MQRYNIFNKHNKICIANEQIEDLIDQFEEVVECNPNTVNSIDFSFFLSEKCERNLLIIVKNLTVEQVFFKAIESLYVVQAAGGLVRNSRNEYLFIYRSGHWDLPKGHREEGEELDYTASREVEEETGISDLEVGEKLGVTYHGYSMNGRREVKQTHWYDMSSKSESKLIPQREEGITKVAWLSKQSVENRGSMIYPSLRAFLSELGFCFNQTL